MTEKFEKFHLDVALVSFLQLERHWQIGEAAELEMSCEAGNLNIQSSQFCLSVYLKFFQNGPMILRVP